MNARVFYPACDISDKLEGKNPTRADVQAKADALTTVNETERKEIVQMACEFLKI